jgi:hypothetical protein
MTSYKYCKTENSIGLKSVTSSNETIVSQLGEHSNNDSGGERIAKFNIFQVLSKYNFSKSSVPGDVYN